MKMRAMSYDPYRGHAPPPHPYGPPREDRSSTAIRIVHLVSGLAASVLVLHLGLTLLGANEGNGFVELIYTLARVFVLDLGAVFTPGDETLRAVLNYGFAALGYLLIGQVIIRALRRP